MKIGYQGSIGSNNERAALKFKDNFKGNIQLIPLVSSENVVNHLKKGTIDYGVMAISNNIVGDVKESILALKNINYQLISKIELKIIHNLATLELTKNITTIRSHIQALSQSANWINQNLPHCILIEEKDTALAASKLRSGDYEKNTAVICSPEASKVYNLKIIEENISNNNENYTTFILIKLIDF
jgi:prephenate dehydratase